MWRRGVPLPRRFRVVGAIEGFEDDYEAFRTQIQFNIWLIRSDLATLPPRIPYSLQLPDSKASPSEKECVGDIFEETMEDILEYFEDVKGYELLETFSLYSEHGTVGIPLANGGELPFNVNIFEWGLWCHENGEDCIGDNRDTLYFWDKNKRFLNDDDYYVIIGVNHNKCEQSLQNSIGVYYVVDRNKRIFTPIVKNSHSEYEPYSIEGVIPGSSSSSSKGSERHRRDKLFIMQLTRPEHCVDGSVFLLFACLFALFYTEKK